MIDYLLEILDFNLSDDVRYMVIASDGVWEYLSNEDVSRGMLLSLTVSFRLCV